MTETEKLLEERGKRYGQFEDNAHTAQAIKALVKSSDLPPVLAEGLDQICGKLSRIRCGDPMYIDNWRDIAGYATLVADWLDGIQVSQISGDGRISADMFPKGGMEV